MQCVTQLGSSQNCFSARAVAYIIMRLVWKLVQHLFNELDGSAPSVKCARLAGECVLLSYTTHILVYVLCVVFDHFFNA